jgi:hypothetical protein
MKTIWTGRLTEAAAKYSESAPMATACCNACRTCVQTNLIGVGLAAIIGATAGIARLRRRYLAKPSNRLRERHDAADCVALEP